MPDLSDAKRARIRAEMRYAMAAAEALRPTDRPAPPKPWPERVLGMLSNGFVLLVIGSAITSFLVPQFQRSYEARTRAATLRQEAFAQFLLYSNSMVQEYYAIRLRGFARDGARVEIDLAQCRRIDFAIVGDGPVDRPPLGAKAD